MPTIPYSVFNGEPDAINATLGFTAGDSLLNRRAAQFVANLRHAGYRVEHIPRATFHGLACYSIYLPDADGSGPTDIFLALE